MSGPAPASWQCPQCGFTAPSSDDFPADAFFRPFHVMHGRQGVRAYVSSLGAEVYEWLLALHVDERLQLLAVDPVAQGAVGNCDIPMWKLFSRGHALEASGFILVHNHPSGDPRPSEADMRATGRIARLSQDLEMPLLDHLIIAGDQMISCGYW